jgi:hypothetical protein
MSKLSIEVEIVDGRVTPVPPCVLPSNGRGVLTVTVAAEPQSAQPVEVVEGPDGLLLFRSSGVLTSEMVQKAQQKIDLEDALRYLGPSRAALGKP